MFGTGSGHRMTDRTEIVDHGIALGAQLFRDQRGADHPGVVGETDDFAADRSCNRDGYGLGQRAALHLGEVLPRGLEAGMVAGVERGWFAQADRAVIGITDCP